jgi:hypothetical protein
MAPGSSLWPHLALAVVRLLCLALALTAPLDRDESMYQAAAALLGEGRLYADVPFLQPPYAAWLHGGWQRLWPGDHVLLEARLLAALTAGILAEALLAFWRRLGAPAWAAALLLLLVFQDGIVRETAALARNYDPAQLAVVLALLVLPWRTDGRARRFRSLAGGGLAGVAVGLKLTYAPLALVAVAWPLLWPGRRREVLWTAAGAVLGLLPAVASLAGVDPAALRFQLLDYHVLNARWHAQEGLGRGLDLAGKLDDARRLHRETDHLMIVAPGLIAGVLVARTWWRARRVASDAAQAVPRAVALLMLLAGVVMVAVPRPVQFAYYVPLLLGCCALVAAALGAGGRGRGESRPERRLLGIALALATLVAVVHRAPDSIDLARQAVRPSAWPPSTVHEAGRALAARTADVPNRPVATTHPIYALEAGRPLLPGLASAEFVWRLHGLLDPGLERRLGVVTPRNLARVLAASPPSAVVVRADGPWDAPLVAWARSQDWRSVALPGGAVAWLPGDRAAAADLHR